MLLNWGSSQGLNALMNSANFIAGFADAGSGAVDLTLSKGAGSATFTRATTATTVNSSGTIISVGSGVARSYYDPTTLKYLGYLSEGSRQNLVLNSLIDGTDFSTQSVTVTAVPHTLSFYGTGTITLSGASTAGPLTGTGVYPQRVSLTFTPAAASLTLTVTGSCKFVQLEIGSFASSFIPTAGVAVTRNADVLTYPVSGNLSDTGSCYSEVSSLWSGTSTAQKWIIYGASGAGNGGPLFFNSSSFVSFADGTAQRPSALTFTGPTLAKLATSWGGSSALAARGGSVSSSLTYSGTMALGANFAIGNGFFSGFELFGTVKNARIYQTQLSASQLQAVTA